jgi:hypothetical protein
LGASTPEQFIEQLCCLQACTDIDWIIMRNIEMNCELFLGRAKIDASSVSRNGRNPWQQTCPSANDIDVAQAKMTFAGISRRNRLYIDRHRSAEETGPCCDWIVAFAQMVRDTVGRICRPSATIFFSLGFDLVRSFFPYTFTCEIDHVFCTYGYWHWIDLCFLFLLFMKSKYCLEEFTDIIRWTN